MPRYRLYGFTLQSDIALLALPQIVGGDPADADVEISAGPVPETVHMATSFRNWEAEPGCFLSTFHETGRFLVSDGRHIRYDRFDGADDSQVVSILLGTCMAALLMQRRILPVHSCSVRTERGAILVMGMSGAGKSTMLGGLLDLGLPMMADDVTGLIFDTDGRPTALPAFPATRLWADSLRRLGHDTEGLPRVRTDMAKYYRAIDYFHPDPVPIRAIVYLQPTNLEQAAFTELDPAKRVECLSRFVHRKNFLAGMELQRWAFQAAVETVRQVPMFHLMRPAHWVEPRELAEQVLGAIAQAETAVEAAGQ